MGESGGNVSECYGQNVTLFVTSSMGRASFANSPEISRCSLDRCQSGCSPDKGVNRQDTPPLPLSSTRAWVKYEKRGKI